MEIKEKIGGIQGKVKCILKNIHTNEIKIYEYDNLITTAGLVAIARRLGGIALKSNEGQITYGATGTNATAPAIGDTTLGTELARKLFSSTSYASNVSTLRVFFNTSESNGALKEFGLFGEDATASADSGTLFEHAAMDITKTVADTLTVECIIIV